MYKTADRHGNEIVEGSYVQRQETANSAEDAYVTKVYADGTMDLQVGNRTYSHVQPNQVTA